jgi:hypothetical protein
MADFNKVFDLLKLENSPNKVAAVKSWLANGNNTDWLLIFDNADDLAAICLSDYFPATSWGHIVITSRDQATIGLVSSDGLSLEPPNIEDAVAMLLHKSNIKAASPEMMNDAEAIVEALGCLPLALDQAGSYILTRKKTLADYRRLYLTRQQDLLGFHPRLSDYDKSVLTAWELNFAQVEKELPEAARLLMLFCFMDAVAITDNMLLRGCTKQNRWNNQGEIEEVSAEVEGVDPYIIRVITDEVFYDNAVEKLMTFSLIMRNNDYNEIRSVSLHPLVQSTASLRLSQAERNKWRSQAMLLVCHSFPRNQYIEDS